MNSIQQIHRLMNAFRGLMRGPVVGLGSALLLCSAAAGADDYYINNAIVSYLGTESSAPHIDATNFVNNSQFTINFTYFNLTPPLFETWDTVNYTNYSYLTANTGFRFDNQSSGSSGTRRWSGSFFNQGFISCGSVNNTSDPFLGSLALGTVTLGQLSSAQCLVTATNIQNPGSVDVGVDGLIEFYGNNVDLSYSSLNIEGTGLNGAGNNVYVTGSGVFGLNTNFWDPSVYFNQNFILTPPIAVAQSLFFGNFFGQMYLTNFSTYIDQVSPDPGTIITRVVFIEDNSGPNMATRVYFNSGGLGFGNGNVTVEWSAGAVDPASANVTSNYLYLNDNYAYGASTNVQPIIGIPNNFTFTATAAPEPLLGQPAPNGFVNVFLPGAITNLYDFANVQLSASSISTNSIPNHSVTNLPGRVQIIGANNLDLTGVQITGPNYVQIQSSNQFNGSAGAFIQAPYADINLGVTNGYLAVSNLISAGLPNWGGNVQAWNTRWIEVDPNTGITNDFRVLVVGSVLTPYAQSQVQDLVLHGTNTVISDTFNVMRKFYSDAQSLTVTTNPPGFGATSFEGELNLGSPSIFWQSCVPNLRYLTNYGAIRMQNLAYYSYPNQTNVTTAVAAIGTLAEIGTNVVKNDKVTIGASVYTFVSTITNTVANQVKIVPNSFDASMSNLIAAINHGAGAGTTYSTNTVSNLSVAAGPLIGHAFTVTAFTAGAAGNSIVTTFSPATLSSNLTWQGHSTLYGGVSATPIITSLLPQTAFINHGIFMDQGSIFYAGDFEASGVVSNGVGQFTLQSLTTTLTNLALYAGADVNITADTLIVSNTLLLANGALTLTVTNLLTDTGVTNGNIWSVGSNTITSGLNLPIKPAAGDLLGTMLTLVAPTNRTVANVWAGSDRGLSPAGYVNNEAIGILNLDIKGPDSANRSGRLVFNGAGVSNALYVDLLELSEYGPHGNATNAFNFPWLQINTNMVIYFAQALENGISVAQQIDYASLHGANNGRLRWISSYAGYFSSTNIIYTNADLTLTTNTVNAALAQSSTIDSDGDGIPNNVDPTPFFSPADVNLVVTMTNVPPMSAQIRWTTVPNATNYVFYSTNMMSTNWLPLTNFPNWYFGNVTRTNASHVNWFISPQNYITNASLPDNSQRTNVWIYDAITNVPHYYRVVVWPWLNFGI